MFRFSKDLLLRIVLVCSLLLPFVVFSSILQPWKNGNLAGMVAQELLYPIEYVWEKTTGWLSSLWTHYISLSKASIENDSLKQKIGSLSARILDYEEQQLEISRLRKLLGFSQHYAGQQIAAEIIGSVRSEHFFTLRIAKGSWDDVHIGMPVVTGNGIVGRIIRTGKKFSDVHILTDPNFYLDVLLQRTRVRGILQGKGGGYCLLTLNQRADVKIGDTVITSGILGSFPKGLPVGKVIRISYESDDVSQTIMVEPWVDHRSIEEVIVLKENDPEVQKIIEAAGESWLEDTIQNPAKR